MARDRICSRGFVPLSMALLLLSGCPSSCQQRRETTKDSGAKLAVKVQRAEIEKQKETTTRKGSRVIKRLRPDGTPWEVVSENDDQVTKLEIDRELLEKAEGASLKWDHSKDVKVTRPWWWTPSQILVVVIALGLLVGAIRKFG